MNIISIHATVLNPLKVPITHVLRQFTLQGNLSIKDTVNRGHLSMHTGTTCCPNYTMASFPYAGQIFLEKRLKAVAWYLSHLAPFFYRFQGHLIYKCVLETYIEKKEQDERSTKASKRLPAINCLESIVQIHEGMTPLYMPSIG